MLQDRADASSSVVTGAGLQTAEVKPFEASLAALYYEGRRGFADLDERDAVQAKIDALLLRRRDAET